LNAIDSTRSLHQAEQAAIFGTSVEVSRSKRQKGKSMPLLQILLTLIVVGVLLWLVNSFIPMAGSIKSILNAVVIIGVVLWLLDVFGLFHSISRIRVG
jgi:Flp pilus assembly protein TadB